MHLNIFIHYIFITVLESEHCFVLYETPKLREVNLPKVTLLESGRARVSGPVLLSYILLHAQSPNSHLW